MVPDSDTPDPSPSDSAEIDGARADSDAPRAGLGDLQDGDAYDLVYRATRDALWDVLGTATLILFYLALAGVGFAVTVANIVPFVRGATTVSGLVVGLAGVAVAAFAGIRVYRLVTE